MLTLALLIPLRLTPQPNNSKQPAGKKAYGVIVGISKFDSRGVPWLNYADRDAGAFAAYLGAQQGIRVFQETAATLPAVREAIRKALTQDAGPTDDVYLFFSGRGTANSDLDDGFILLSDSNSSRGVSTALSSKELAVFIRQSSAARIFLIADLCRDPDSTARKNLITAKLEQLASIKPSVTAVLASKVEQHSAELDAQRNGVFSYYLLSGLKTNPSNLQELMEFLRTKVPPASRTHQVPFLKGSVSPSLFHLPLNRAQARPVKDQGSFFIRAAYQMDGSEDDLSAFHDELVMVTENFPEAAVQLFRRAAPDMQQREREAFAIALEERGQRELVLYGEGDQFPDDPQRPGKKQFEIASSAFEQARAIGGDPAVSASLSARHLFSAGRAMLLDANYDSARIALQQSIQAKPEYPEAYNATGISYLEKADYPQAIRYFKGSIERAPDWAYARHNLALAYIESGNYAAGERAYREAIARTPYQPYLYYNLGVLLHRLNRKSDAKVEYTRAIGEFEARAHDLQSHAERCKEEGEVARGKVYSQRRDVLIRNEAEVYNALGAIAQAQGNPGAAEAAYRNARARNPSLLLAIYNFGTLLASKKDLDGAIQLWREVLQQDANHLPSRLRLAEAYQQQGRLTEAIAEYRQVSSLQPNSEAAARLPESLGDLSASKGDTKLACEQYRLAAEAYGPDRRQALRKKLTVTCQKSGQAAVPK